MLKGKKISDADRKFFNRRQQIRERRAADEKLKQLQEQKDRAVIDMKNTLDKIEVNLNKALTLKN